MVYEPEILAGEFPRRAERWVRISGYRNARTVRNGPLCATYYTMPAADVDAKGVKLAFFSDLHYTGTPKELQTVLAAVEFLEDFRPDYLLFGGDLAGHTTGLETSFSILERFGKFDCPKLAVPGNWECGKQWIPAQFWIDRYRQYGFRYLNNEMFSDRRCAIYGLGDTSGSELPRRPTWPETAGRQRIILTHRADNAIAIDSRTVTEPLAPLILSGHVHGGQIRLPLIGPVYRKLSRYGARFDYGVYRHTRGDRLVVTSGMGEMTCPIRFLCRREIVLIELQ